MAEYSIRVAAPGDAETIVALLRELADYEKLLDRFHITPEVVRRDYFGDGAPISSDLLFEGGKAAAIASWFWTYGSFAARRKIYLADFFVRPEFRGKHYGRALIAHLARRALAQGAAGIHWEVLDWNKPSIDFYDALGATPIKGWTAYDLNGEALARAAKL